MRLERVRGRIFVNSVFVGKSAVDSILGEILTKDGWKKVSEKLTADGYATVDFSYTGVIPDYRAELETEKKKNRLLKAKLAAIEKMFFEV